MRRSSVALVLLTISGAANIWLVSQLLGSRAADEPGSISVAHDQGSVFGPGGTFVHQSNDNGRKADFLLQVEEEVLGDAKRLADTYWASTADFELGYSRAMFEAQAEIRRRLLDAYGHEVADDPVFRQVFRPMGLKYSFLNSDQQVGIQQLRFERDLQLHNAARARNDALSMRDGTVVDPAMVQSITRRYQQGLRDLLDDDTLFEFLLRESQPAQQLRASGVSLSEAEFRAAVLILNELQDGYAGPQQALQARTALRELLGGRRFAEFWASTDPMYARLREVAARHDLRDGVVMSVYETLNDFQDLRMQVAGLSEATPERVGEEFQRLAEDERRQIANLVGDEVTNDILRSRAVMSTRLFGGMGPSQ